MTILRRAFYGFAFATFLLLVALLIAEGALRLTGYGHSSEFWRKTTDAEGQPVIRENPWVTSPFFAPELTRRPQPFILPAQKAPRTYRIFILGSSAAMGDPDASFSMARVLETLLRGAYPELRFEVVNAGITAVNSHVVRSVAAACAELQPDLFIVYEGHNEVIGPFGPGTVFTTTLQHPVAVRAAVFFRELRLGQWLTHTVGRSLHPAAADGEWGGMQMFLEHKILRSDARLDATRRLFAANLQAIARMGRGGGARVFFSTVLTNQRDFSPFYSAHRASLTEAELRDWESAFRAGQAAAKAGNWMEAEESFRRAILIDPLYAEGQYQMARTLFRRGNFADVKIAFQEALDLDLLRFRTDSRLNEALRSVAAEAGDGVKLIDTVRVAEAESLGGVVGDEMLYEHVHLNFRGTYVVARTFLQHVAEDLRARGLVGEEAPRVLPLDEVRTALAFTTYEQAMIAKEMLGRLKRAPFSGQSSNADRIAAYEQRDARAAQLLALPESKAAMRTIYEQAITRSPDDWVLRRNFGMSLVAGGEAAAAKEHLLAALKIIPDELDTLNALAYAHRQLGETADEARVLAELDRLEPRYRRGSKGMRE